MSRVALLKRVGFRGHLLQRFTKLGTAESHLGYDYAAEFACYSI